MKIKKIVLWVLTKIFGFTPLNNREIEKYRTFIERCKFMHERGWECRVGERGGMGWYKTEPDEYYKDKPSAFWEYREYVKHRKDINRIDE